MIELTNNEILCLGQCLALGRIYGNEVFGADSNKEIHNLCKKLSKYYDFYEENINVG